MYAASASSRLCLGTLGATAMLLCGCGAVADVDIAPTVSKDVLQREISNRLATAGQTPQSVTCAEDLVGEVGMTARCEVVLSPTNSFAPVIAVTRADGDAIDYEMTPAVSRTQLEQAVSRLAAAPVESVTCESGLDGEVGAVAHCDVDAGGVKVRRTVTVNRVDGLMMNFDLAPL